MKKISSLLLSAAAYLQFAPSALAQDITVSIPKPSGFNITNLGKVISSLISIVLVLAAISAFAFLLWGGFQWITSGGDKAQVEAARNRIQAALLGLLIVFASYAVFIVVEGILGIKILTGFTLPTLTGN